MAKEFFMGDRILSHIVSESGGFSRPNLYEMIITPPKSLAYDGKNAERISMNCSTTSLVGMSLMTHEQDQGGQIIQKIPHGVTYNDLSCMFYLSNDLVEKEFFDTWQSLVFEPDTGNLHYFNEYISTLQINKVSKSIGYEVMQSYIFENAYPIIVGDVELTYEAQDQYARLPVTFAYRRWRREFSADKVINGANNPNLNNDGFDPRKATATGGGF